MAPVKAINAAKKVKGENKKKIGKVHYKTHFYLPKTLKLARNPKYARKSLPKDAALDKYSIVKCPLTTETAMKMVESENTLVFLVDVRANKRQISKAVKDLYNVDAEHINTLIRPDGQKKAFVRLPADQEALEVATHIGIV